MKKLFFLFLVLTINLLATTINVQSLSKDTKAKNILEDYLKKTIVEIKNIPHLNIYLGDKEEIKILDNSLYNELNKYKNDGFIIKLKKDSLFIIGVNKRSSLYASYHFLEKLNYKFLSKDFEIIPKKVLLNKEELEFKSEARFKYREIFIKELEDNEFASKLYLNGSFGHKAKKDSDFFINSYNYFTPFELIKEKYRDIYPEFFCSGQLDFTLKDVQRYANINFQKRVKAFRENDEDIYYIQHEDILSYCTSRQSRKLINKYNSTSAPFLEYTNYIAKQNPTKNIFFEAYQWSRKAPENFPKLSQNLGIFFSNIESNFFKAINEDENNYLFDDLKSWFKYKKDIYIWNYITNFNGYFQPFPSILANSKNIKLYSNYELIKGVFLQGAYETEFSNLSNLRAWVLSKLLWNPKLDEKKLIEEFVYYYYGKNSYKEVLNYFKLLKEEVEQTDSKLLIKTSINSRYLNEKFIKKSKKILNKAISKTKKDSIHYKHLIELYSGIYYTELLKGTISDADKKTFKIFLEENNIKHHSENNKISSLNTYFDIERKTPNIPKTVQENQNLEWLDFQEYELKLCCTDTVEDKKASSSSAVRMNGNKSDWGIQLDLTTIPKGKWEVYANIRIEKAKNHSSVDLLKPAIYYGIHEKGIKNFSLLNSLKDENYHEVLIGKINVEDNEIGQVWIRPPNDTNVKYIFVDRIFIIRD